MRRYFIFFLLPAFVAFLGYLVMLGWWWTLKQTEAHLEQQSIDLYDAQQPAIAAIERMSGDVVRDHSRRDLGWPAVSASFGSSSKPVVDSDFLPLKSLPHLRSIFVYGARLDGNGLSHLRDLPELTKLELSDKIADRALVPLAQLQQLRCFSIRTRLMSNDALAYIAMLRNLTHLSINKAGITDDGLKHLDSLVNLEVLELADTQVTELGVRNFQARHPKVKVSFNPEIIAPDPPPLRLP